jgi:hypothetical protein
LVWICALNLVPHLKTEEEEEEEEEKDRRQRIAED